MKKGAHAGNLTASLFVGGGGGRPNMAQPVVRIRIEEAFKESR